MDEHPDLDVTLDPPQRAHLIDAFDVAIYTACFVIAAVAYHFGYWLTGTAALIFDFFYLRSHLSYLVHRSVNRSRLHDGRRGPNKPR